MSPFKKTPKTPWKSFNPQWLVDVAKERLPKEGWLQRSLKKCTKCLIEKDSYYRFVLETQGVGVKKKERAEKVISLKDTEHGHVYLDILKGKRVGGIKFKD